MFMHSRINVLPHIHTGTHTIHTYTCKTKKWPQERLEALWGRVPGKAAELQIMRILKKKKKK